MSAKIYADASAELEKVSERTGLTKVRSALSAQQVKLRANKRFRLLVLITTLFAVFIDILGTAMTMPVLPSICGYATGGPVMNILVNPLIVDMTNGTGAGYSTALLAELELIRNSQGVATLRANGHLRLRCRFAGRPDRSPRAGRELDYSLRVWWPAWRCAASRPVCSLDEPRALGRSDRLGRRFGLLWLP